MATKHFFTKNNERVGKKSGKPRGKYKKHGQVLQEEKVVFQPTPEIKLKTNKLPSISRKITESISTFKINPQSRFSWKMGGLAGFFLVILGLSVWQGIVAIEKSLLLKDVVAKRIKLAQEMTLWEDIAAKYPGYRDAYFQAAVLAYRLGDKEKEMTYLDKALQIDPNYQPAKNLEKLQ